MKPPVLAWASLAPLQLMVAQVRLGAQERAADRRDRTAQAARIPQDLDTETVSHWSPT